MKILWLSDTPAMPSGYGVQTRLVLRGLQAMGHETFCLGGALNHPSMQPQLLEGVRVIPVQGYGTNANIREALRVVRPDVMVVCPDPRFLTHVWNLENEIRQQCPLLYWHIWDNEPYPVYNNSFYASCSAVASASLFTQELLRAKGRRSTHIPLAADSTVYTPLPAAEVAKMRASKGGADSFWVVSVNRNAGRKRVVDLLAIFAKFHKIAPNAKLLLHTDPDDPEGPSLTKAIEEAGLPADVVHVSVPRGQPSSYVNQVYNMGHVHISISMNEGVGVTVVESMAAGLPNIVTATGGMAELVAGAPSPKMSEMVQRYSKGWLVAPAVRSLGGANSGTAYIYQDWVADGDVVNALEQAYKTPREDLAAMGAAAREAVVAERAPDRIAGLWDALMKQAIEHAVRPPRYTITDTLKSLTEETSNA